jgi:hypothetical protein
MSAVSSSSAAIVVDDIDTYLDGPPIPPSSVAVAGGALKWWFTQEQLRPTVFLMAMDFISAPHTFHTTIYYIQL